jgi:hypothetical protein
MYFQEVIVLHVSVWQNVVSGTPLVRDGVQAFSEEKALQTLYQTLNE